MLVNEARLMLSRTGALAARQQVWRLVVSSATIKKYKWGLLLKNEISYISI